MKWTIFKVQLLSSFSSAKCSKVFCGFGNNVCSKLDLNATSRLSTNANIEEDNGITLLDFL